MPIKLGKVDEKLTYNRAYLGSNLVFQKISEIEFSSCPFPTSWTQVTLGTEYKASNKYGEWSVLATNYDSSSKNYAYYAFDNVTSDSYKYWGCYSSTIEYLTINCPSAIKPLSGTIVYNYLGNQDSSIGTNLAKIQGYNLETNQWEDLYTMPKVTSKTTQNFSISTENYYTKFRVVAHRYNNVKKSYVYEFKITSGVIKKNA